MGRGKMINNKNVYVPDSFIEIICDKKKIMINMSEILYIERNSRKIRIVTKNENYECYDTLKSMQERLPKNFVRCHTGYIANMDYVTSIHSRYLVLKDGTNISIGRTFKGGVAR